MAKSVLAELVTKMTVESSQFKKELERTTAKTVKFGKEQKKAANDATFSSAKMSKAFKQAANSASTLQGPMGGIAARISTLSSGFGAVGVAATAAGIAISGAAAMTGLAVMQFAEMEKRLFRTEALFNSTNGAAGLTTSELAGLANEVAENTLASVVGVTSAINVLQTFKSISGDTFIRTVELSQDLAAVMGTDVKNASLQLGKALEDPILGLNSLRRSGVSFSDSQKELIRTLVETGDVAQAQEMILNSLESQVGGAGSAEGMGLAGATDLLGQRWDELLESFALTTGVGTGATNALNSISGALAGITGMLASTDGMTNLANELAYVNGMLSKPGLLGGKETAALEARKAVLLEEIAAIEGKELRELEIIKQGEIDKAQARAEAAAARLVKQEEVGATQLLGLEKQLGTEQEVIIAKWEERNAAIEGLVLSEEEIRKRGYENLMALQDDYFKKSSDLAGKKLADIQIKAEKEVQAQNKAEQKRGKNAQSNFFADLQTAAGQNKKLAAIAKAGAIVNATIKTYEAVNNALAAPFPPPIPQIFAATALAAGLSNVAAIKSQPIAGARAMGGPVSGGKSYLVGERGPELFTPQATGQITSNQNLQRVTGDSGPNITYAPMVNGSGLNKTELFNILAKNQKQFGRMVNALIGVPS